MAQADAGGFDAYVAARWSRLVRGAILLGCSPPEAEDVVQTALARCLVGWARVSAAEDRDAYVHRVLVNTFTSSRRRRWTGERATARPPDSVVPGHAAAVELRAGVERSLGRLTPDQRAAVVLRYYLDLSEQQMAAVLDVAPGTVKSRLSRALAALAVDPDVTDLKGSP